MQTTYFWIGLAVILVMLDLWLKQYLAKRQHIGK
ncbi:hypothetical protein ABMA08_17595 [Pseudomonas yamanorum]